MKLRKAFILLAAIFTLAACGNSGGNSGDNTKPLEEGNIYHGNGVPSDNLGKDYSHYYDVDSRLVYEKKDGKWVNQMTIGSSALYTNVQSKKVMRAPSLPDGVTTQTLKDALMMSFYSTHTSCFMEQYFEIFPGVDGPVPAGPGHGSFVNVMIDGRNIRFPDINYGDRPDYTPQPDGYCKIDEEGHCFRYDGSQYVLQDDSIKAFLPVPTFDNLAYYFLSIYDDKLGEQTSIACGHMDEVKYDQDTGYYHIENVQINHGPIYNYQTMYEVEDTMVLDYQFRLSSDKTYVDRAVITIISSAHEELSYFKDLITTYDFKDMHTASFDMPE